MSSNSSSKANNQRPESFQLKGALLPMSVLELKTADINLVKEELKAKVDSAPGFFRNNPVVFSFDLLENHEGFRLEELITFCRQLKLLPAGVKGANKGTESKALSLSLAAFPKGKVKDINNSETAEELDNSLPAEEPSSQDQILPEQSSAKSESQPQVQSAPEPVPATKIVTVQVRSGQQIYSAGDMIILSSVSPGAEVLAAGNIHVYGALRGRALAGVHGDEKARIFCQKQEAELISIAGHFLNDENLRDKHWNASVQAFFNGQELMVDKLSD